MRIQFKALLFSALCAAGMGAHGNAGAAGFFVEFSNLLASCTDTGISGSLTANVDLPDAANNLIVTTSINGGASTTSFFTHSPAIDSGSLSISYTIPSTPQPYIISGTVFPALNGSATGSGVSATYTCNANGTVTAGFVPVAVATGVPTLSQWGLAALALLLALGSALRIRRAG